MAFRDDEHAARVRAEALQRALDEREAENEEQRRELEAMREELAGLKEAAAGDRRREAREAKRRERERRREAKRRERELARERRREAKRERAAARGAGRGEADATVVRMGKTPFWGLREDPLLYRLGTLVLLAVLVMAFLLPYWYVVVPCACEAACDEVSMPYARADKGSGRQRNVVKGCLCGTPGTPKEALVKSGHERVVFAAWFWLLWMVGSVVLGMVATTLVTGWIARWRVRRRA